MQLMVKGLIQHGVGQISATHDRLLSTNGTIAGLREPSLPFRRGRRGRRAIERRAIGQAVERAATCRVRVIEGLKAKAQVPAF